MTNHEASQSNSEDENSIFEQLIPPLSYSETSENELSIFSVYGEGMPNQVTEHVMHSLDGGVMRVRSFSDNSTVSENFDPEGLIKWKLTIYTDGTKFIEGHGGVTRMAPNGDMFRVEPGGVEQQIAKGTDTISLGALADGVSEAVKTELDERQQPSIPLSLFVDDFTDRGEVEDK